MDYKLVLHVNFYNKYLNLDPVLQWKSRNAQPQFAPNPMEFFDVETLSLAPFISKHDSDAFFRVFKTLVFLVQDLVHVTPFNFDSCAECLRSMVEASMDGGSATSMPTSVTAAAASSPASLAGSLSSSVENISRAESPIHSGSLSVFKRNITQHL